MTESGAFSIFGDLPTANAAAIRAHIEQGRQNGLYDEHLTILGNTLATRLDGEDGFDALGYIAAVDMPLYDCTQGINERTGKPMPRDITGYSAIVI